MKFFKVLPKELKACNLPKRDSNTGVFLLIFQIVLGQLFYRIYIVIELEKAFDTINHDILLRKMSAVRFSDLSINWFQSYLPNRSFQVNVLGKYSCIAKLTVGCPRDLY